MLTIGILVDAPPPTAAAVEQAVSEGCEAVVGPSRCPATRSLHEASITTWVAVVRPRDTTWLRLSLDFHDRTPNGALLEHRELAFSEYDAPENRWAGTGAVIAAFVAARDVDTAQSAKQGFAEQPPPAPPPPPSAEPETHPWAFDIAALSGAGTREPMFRFGALARVSLEVPRAPGMISLIDVRYTERTASTTLRWWSSGIGIGARFEFDGLALGAEFEGQLVFERLWASARDPESGAGDSVGINRFGGRLGIHWFWQAWPSLGFLIGSDVHLLRPEVNIYEMDAYVGPESAIGYAFWAGVRFTP